uniref:Thioredoxin-like protein n=1 Tax=Strombidinopsis acuminata TaxID=141414 RepID=A0A7S3RUS1_9SPIT|mmetsp:Transcript_119463/g.166669  ORF Transcript_119463/g.166669 Transcript_119463/m.166669 type:complete len:191 (+) Transcript_119463:1-573(+)
MKFLALKDWVNLHSESGMGDKLNAAGGGKEESVEEAKPWLVQEVPELTAKSHQDICFKGEGLCVIYLKDGEISPEETDMLSGLSKQFTSQLSDRGAKMKWMWMNLGLESEYKALFDTAVLPSAVVFNPHKRLRFTKLDHGEDNELKGDAAGLSKLMDKVLGGDARFKMVPGQKLPGWAKRDPPAAKKAEL